MRNAQGYACISGPDGTREADTFTCAHDNRVVHVKAGAKPEDIGGLCKSCMRLICPHCLGQPCVPFLKKIEQEEARYHALRSYGF